MARLGEPAVLVRLAAKGFDEAHSAHDLLEDAGDLAVVAAQAAMAGAQPSKDRLKGERQEWRDDERDDGEPHRVAEQNDDRPDDLRRVLQRFRHELGDEHLRLLRVRQHARDDLARLGALKVEERQSLQVREHAVAQITRHVFLKGGAELSAEPDERVLERDDRENRDDHHLHGPEGIRGVEERADEPLLRRGDPLRARRRDVLLRLEQRVQERHQQRERKNVECRGDDVTRDRPDHPPCVRAEKPQ